MSVAIFPDGRHALSGSADGTLKIWDLDTGAVVQTMTGHQGFITSVALFPGARLAVSASEDGTLRVWDVARGETVMSFTSDGELRTCAVMSDGRTIVAGEDSGRLHFLRYEREDPRPAVAADSDREKATEGSDRGRRAGPRSPAIDSEQRITSRASEGTPTIAQAANGFSSAVGPYTDGTD